MYMPTHAQVQGFVYGFVNQDVATNVGGHGYLCFSASDFLPAVSNTLNHFALVSLCVRVSDCLSVCLSVCVSVCVCVCACN